MFTVQLRHYNAWDVLHKGAEIQLASHGRGLCDLYARDKLQERLGSFQPPMIAGHTRRQDFALPHPPGYDWKEQEQEEVYIHFLRLIAYAIDERFKLDVAKCVAPFNCDNTPYSRVGMRSIKGFARMFNKMCAAEDHRYEKKPRPGYECFDKRVLICQDY